MDRVGATETHIEFVKVPGNKVTFENLEIATPSGCTMLSEQYVQIALGERVVIVGAPGTRFLIAEFLIPAGDLV
jgi:vitamin B12/bleomycin/antimicrobial peptide transport system ATP-binding/permease protein